MEKNFRKYFHLFSKTFSQIFLDFGQNRLISQDFSKLKRKNKNLPNYKIWAGWACKTEGFLFSLSVLDLYIFKKWHSDIPRVPTFGSCKGVLVCLGLSDTVEL